MAPPEPAANLLLITFDQWRGDWGDPHDPVVDLPALQELAAATNALPATNALRRTKHSRAALMPHHYAIVALLSTASALLPRLAPRQQRRAPVRHILDNSQDDPIARFERENDGAKVFEKLVEYPCEFTIKVIGFDDRGKVKLSMRLVDQETGEDLEEQGQEDS